jgi:hypothetical protein
VGLGDRVPAGDGHNANPHAMTTEPLPHPENLYWVCRECGHGRSDLMKRLERFLLPCPRCDRGPDALEPHIRKRANPHA